MTVRGRLRSPPAATPDTIRTVKTCPNCRMLHEDDYVGSCPNCGGNMANIASGHADPLAARYAQQMGRIRSGPDEAGLHSMMRRGDFGGLIDENLLEVSKSFLIQKKKGN